MTTIILSCITVSAGINYGSPSQLVIYSNDLGSPNKVNKDDKANEVICAMVNGTKQKYLPALFGKTLDCVSVETKESKSYFTRSNSETAKVVFELKYLEKQTITVEGQEIEFFALAFEIEESQERSVMKIYALDEDVVSSSVGYYTTIKVTGDFADAYLLIKGYINEYIA